MAAICASVTHANPTKDKIGQPIIGDRSAPLLHQDGLTFRDLDRSGQLEPYEDWRLSPEQRADDLIERMTLPEKAGAMLLIITLN